MKSVGLQAIFGALGVLINTVFGICKAYTGPRKNHAFWRQEHIYPIYHDLRSHIFTLIYILYTRCSHPFFSVCPAVSTFLMVGSNILKPQKGATGRCTHSPHQPFSSAELQAGITKMNILVGEVFRMIANEQARWILTDSACGNLQARFQL